MDPRGGSLIFPDFYFTLGRDRSHASRITKKKGITQQELADDYLSRIQIFNIEQGKQSTSFEKILYFLDKLGLTYDEFMYFLDADYHTAKSGMLIKISKFSNAGSVKDLESLKWRAGDLFVQYRIDYFHFLTCMAEARITLIETKNNFEKSRKHLLPIKEYLLSLKSRLIYERKKMENRIFLVHFITLIE